MSNDLKELTLGRSMMCHLYTPLLTKMLSDSHRSRRECKRKYAPLPLNTTTRALQLKAQHDFAMCDSQKFDLSFEIVSNRPQLMVVFQSVSVF